MQKKREKAEWRQSLPDPYMYPSEAHEYFVIKRLPPGEIALPMHKYLEAFEQMQHMRRFSTRLGQELPPLGEAETEPTAPTASSIPSGGDDTTPLQVLGTWTELGPENIGGRTRAILIDPDDPDTMWAGGVAGGVFRTTDGGASWTPVADLISNLAVNSMAMVAGAAGTSDNIIYAGTGEGFFNGDAVRGAGIFKSTDGGDSWSQLASTDNSDFFFVNDIVISPNDPTMTVYAATRTGVWRSADAGSTWTRILDPPAALQPTRRVIGGCLDLAIRTDLSPDTLFASCGTFDQASIWRTTDAQTAASVLNWTEVHTEANMGRTSLAIAPSNQATIYALSACDSCPNSNFEQGLLVVKRSTNGGTIWPDQHRNTFDAGTLNNFLLTNPLFGHSSCGINQFSNQGWYDNIIAVDPVDSGRVWACGIDCFRSTDAGVNWELASFWWFDEVNQGVDLAAYAHADHHALVFHPDYDGGTTNEQLFTGNDGGIFRTDNAVSGTTTTNPCPIAITWTLSWTERNSGYGTMQFYHGIPFPDGTTYFGGTQDNGTAIGSDGGGTMAWADSLGGDGGYVAVDDSTTPETLFAENTRLSIQKCTDGAGCRNFEGEWNDATCNDIQSVDPSSNFLFIAPHVMDPNNSMRLWIGGRFIWRTDNQATCTAGQDWTQASTEIPDDTANFPADTNAISAFAVANGNSDRVLVGTRHGIILQNNAATTAGSSTVWNQTQPRVGFVSSVAFDPADQSIAYATYSTFGGSKVFRSSDGGLTFPTDITSNLPDVPVHVISVDPADSNTLYVGTDVGVFISQDGGSSWAVENTGFANVITENLAVTDVSGTTPTLFAFTHGRGAWRVPLTTGANPVPVLTAMLSPSTFPTTASGFTLTVLGSDFISNSIVRWDGSDRTTTFDNSTVLRASISTSDVAGSGSAEVTVFNPSPGGGTSNALTFFFDTSSSSGSGPSSEPTNPRPVLNSLSILPDKFEGNTITVAVSGMGFLPESVVRVNGVVHPSQFVSDHELAVNLSPAEITKVGMGQLAVFNPAPGGGSSQPLFITLTDLERQRKGEPEASRQKAPVLLADQPGLFALTFFSPRSFIRGKVKDMNDEPLEDVQVTVYQDSARRFSTTTDAQGTFQVAVVAGTYDIEVTKAGYDGESLKSLQIEVDQTHTIADLTLKKPADE